MPDNENKLILNRETMDVLIRAFTNGKEKLVIQIKDFTLADNELVIYVDVRME